MKDFTDDELEDMRVLSYQVKQKEAEKTCRLRDQFAMAALTGCLAEPECEPEGSLIDGPAEPTEAQLELARYCYEMADAMLKVRVNGRRGGL